MNKKIYISNLNSISALFDRLIIENIKLNHFSLTNNIEKIKEQKDIISLLKNELEVLMLDTIDNKQYHHISENRTFELKKKIEIFIDEVFNLCNSNLKITYCDKTKLKEIKSEKINADLVLELEYENRKNLEKRSAHKNNIDDLYESILYSTK
jgi:hypothetical protein